MREILFDGPQPPPGRQWCALSALEFKTAVEKASRSFASAAQELDGAGPYAVDMLQIAARHRIELPHEADLVAPCVALGGQPVPLCWSHAPVLQQASPLAVPGSVLPNGQPLGAALGAQPPIRA
jgi:hypothetical protein